MSEQTGDGRMGTDSYGAMVIVDWSSLIQYLAYMYVPTTTVLLHAGAPFQYGLGRTVAAPSNFQSTQIVAGNIINIVIIFHITD